MVRVVPVPLLSDNYGYLIIDSAGKNALAVDPAEAKKVIEAAKQENVKIVGILTTHHHWDHAGGNEDLVSLLEAKIPVYGGDDRIGALTNKVGQGDNIEFDSLNIKVLFTPCHTTGHVLYYLNDETNRFLFSGDTLFIGGCGRFFEGTAGQMVDALKQISELPEDTKVMCGHEYTVANLSFAAKVDPNNKDLQKKLAWSKQQREKKLFTIPSTVSEELSYNPFMRVKTPAIQGAVNLPGSTSTEVMAALRSLKNNTKL